MGVPVPKRGGRVASLSSIRSTALRDSYEYRRASNHRAQLLQRRGGARKLNLIGAIGAGMYYVGSPAVWLVLHDFLQ